MCRGGREEGREREKERKKLHRNWYKMPLFWGFHVIYLRRTPPGLKKTCEISVWGLLSRPASLHPEWAKHLTLLGHPSPEFSWLWTLPALFLANTPKGRQEVLGPASCPSLLQLYYTHPLYPPCPTHLPHSPIMQSQTSLCVGTDSSSFLVLSLYLNLGSSKY